MTRGLITNTPAPLLNFTPLPAQGPEGRVVGAVGRGAQAVGDALARLGSVQAAQQRQIQMMDLDSRAILGIDEARERASQEQEPLSMLAIYQDGVERLRASLTEDIDDRRVVDEFNATFNRRISMGAIQVRRASVQRQMALAGQKLDSFIGDTKLAIQKDPEFKDLHFKILDERLDQSVGFAVPDQATADQLKRSIRQEVEKTQIRELLASDVEAADKALKANEFKHLDAETRSEAMTLAREGVERVERDQTLARAMIQAEDVERESLEAGTAQQLQANYKKYDAIWDPLIPDVITEEQGARIKIAYREGVEATKAAAEIILHPAGAADRLRQTSFLPHLDPGTRTQMLARATSRQAERINQVKAEAKRRSDNLLRLEADRQEANHHKNMADILNPGAPILDADGSQARDPQSNLPMFRPHRSLMDIELDRARGNISQQQANTESRALRSQVQKDVSLGQAFQTLDRVLSGHAVPNPDSDDYRASMSAVWDQLALLSKDPSKVPARYRELLLLEPKQMPPEIPMGGDHHGTLAAVNFTKVTGVIPKTVKERVSSAIAMFNPKTGNGLQAALSAFLFGSQLLAADEDFVARNFNETEFSRIEIYRNAVHVDSPEAAARRAIETTEQVPAATRKSLKEFARSDEVQLEGKVVDRLKDDFDKFFAGGLVRAFVEPAPGPVPRKLGIVPEFQEEVLVLAKQYAMDEFVRMGGENIDGVVELTSKKMRQIIGPDHTGRIKLFPPSAHYQADPVNGWFMDDLSKTVADYAKDFARDMKGDPLHGFWSDVDKRIREAESAAVAQAEFGLSLSDQQRLRRMARKDVVLGLNVRYDATADSAGSWVQFNGAPSKFQPAWFISVDTPDLPKRQLMEFRGERKNEALIWIPDIDTHPETVEQRLRAARSRRDEEERRLNRIPSFLSTHGVKTLGISPGVFTDVALREILGRKKSMLGLDDEDVVGISRALGHGVSAATSGPGGMGVQAGIAIAREARAAMARDLVSQE